MKWISVEDRLPGINTEDLDCAGSIYTHTVLVLTEESYLDSGFLVLPADGLPYWIINDISGKIESPIFLFGIKFWANLPKRYDHKKQEKIKKWCKTHYTDNKVLIDNP